MTDPETDDEPAGPLRPDDLPDPTDPPGVDAPQDLEMVPVETVLLDLGGVILDLGEARGLPWGELDLRGRQDLLERVRDAGGEATEEDLERWLFGPWRRGYARRRRMGREERWGPHLARLQRRAGTAGVTRGGLLEAWAEPYLETLRPLPGVREALTRLAASGLRLALVSNVPLPGVFYRRVLEREALTSFFDALVFSYDQGARKPGPIPVLRALARVGGDPETALMVGDRRSSDIAAGRAAGLRTVWIESDDRAGREGRDGWDGWDGPEPDAAVGSLEELPELLGL